MSLPTFQVHVLERICFCSFVSVYLTVSPNVDCTRNNYVLRLLLILLWFHISSQENLRSVLEDQQLSSRTVDAVMEKVRNRHYQVTFEI